MALDRLIILMALSCDVQFFIINRRGSCKTNFAAASSVSFSIRFSRRSLKRRRMMVTFMRKKQRINDRYRHPVFDLKRVKNV